MALAITGAGGLALLGGVLLLGEVVGSYQLTEILASGDLVRNSLFYLPILGLILLGVFTKSAQFPFHFWLPHAMAAPTPVSAYLHSATMVKAGIFLLARFFPILSGTPEWSWIVGGAGMLTLIIGAYTAFFKHDLKGLLAYSTISHLGLITLLFGFGTKMAAVAAIFHIINHATFKASLFMVAGIIDHETGSRDMRKLNGLIKYMPHTALLAIIASAAMAGVPLLNGFLSKEMFFEQAVTASQASHSAWMIPVLVTIGGVLSVAYSIRFIHDVFFNGEPINLPKVPHEPPRFMKIPVDLLVIICLAVGIFPNLTVAPLLEIAVSGTLQSTIPHYSLAIWHGFTPALIMSLIALSGGIGFYFIRQRLFNFYDRHFRQIDARHFFNLFMNNLFSVANAITHRFDKGSLQNASAWILLSALIFTGYGFVLYDAPLLGDRSMLPIDAISLMLALSLILTSIILVFIHRHRLLTLIVIGMIGLVLSLAFVKFSAPDLALTQLSIEVVTIVLLLLALYFLPQATPKEIGKLRLWRDGILAILSGVGITLYTLSVLTRDYQTIADYFLANSVSGGGEAML